MLEWLSLKDVHVLILGTCDNMKGISQMWLRLKTLEWGGYSGLSRWTQSNHIDPKKKQRSFFWLGPEKETEIQRNVTEEEGGRLLSLKMNLAAVAGFDNGERGPWAKKVQAIFRSLGMALR